MSSKLRGLNEQGGDDSINLYVISAEYIGLLAFSGALGWDEAKEATYCINTQKSISNAGVDGFDHLINS